MPSTNSSLWWPTATSQAGSPAPRAAPLHHQHNGVLEDPLDLGHVEGAVTAVRDAVVGREGQLYHAGGDDFAVLVVVGALRDARDGDDGRLRRVDNRGAAPDAEQAHVGDGERASPVLVGPELA